MDTGASVSEIIRDLDDTPSPVTDAFVFVTDADNVDIPANFVGIVSVRESRDNDPQPSEKGKAKRARNNGGQFKGADPATPDVNEAYDPPTVKKPVKKTVKKAK